MALKNPAISPLLFEVSCIYTIAGHINTLNRCESVRYFGGVDSNSGDELAGQYAYQKAQDCESIADSLVSHFDALREAGANFDTAAAMAEAQRCIQLQK